MTRIDTLLNVGGRVLAGEDDVRAFAGEGELVLDQHLDVAEAGVDEVCPEAGDAALPGPALGGGRGVPGRDRHLLRQVVRELCLGRRQPLRGRAEQEHGQDSPEQHEVRAGGGMS